MTTTNSQRGLDAHFRVLSQQRADAIASIAELQPAELWHRPECDTWSIGEWLDHLYRTLRVQRVCAQLYVPVASPVARLLRHRPYDTTIDDAFADADREVPGPNLPFFRARRRVVAGNCVPLTTLVEDLDRETRRLRRVLDVGEAVAGHIRYPELRFGWLNMVQFVQMIGYHERNDFGHIAEIRQALRP